ncbi:MAG: hypothetical protein LBI85_00870 [Spirochaetaceae bacterium]|jgi:hypothetical protein|nr:hypothetical protein [Spirochaetaceae bacterium]
MRPLDFFSQADRETSFSPEGRLAREFVKLAAPVLGKENALDLCRRTVSRLGENAGPALENMAAFLLGEFDDKTMSLDDELWDEIRESLEDASDSIDLDTLTSLMGGLLSRGKLKKSNLIS